jgi:hypothetical protein
VIAAMTTSLDGFIDDRAPTGVGSAVERRSGSQGREGGAGGRPLTSCSRDQGSVIVPEVSELIRFLEAAFGAVEIAGSRMHNPDGSTMVEAMQQTLVDALREQRARHD